MTKREICERLIRIRDLIKTEGPGMTSEYLKRLLLDLAAPEEKEKEEGEPKSKFPIGHPLHMTTEEMKAADTALFIQTGGRMGKDWRNAQEGEK